MNFSERLNSYLQELGVSAKELSEESGVSQVVISRYRSGQRIPTPENMHSLRDLAIGIESLSRKKKIRLISASEVLEAFDSDLSEVNVSFCDENFNRIMTVFGLNASEMAHSMSYDPS
nr:helix-turn-helix transcriptional regulator [Lachnospiraceae bacterium]